MADVDNASPLYTLLDQTIDGGIDTYVTERRGRGESWRAIELSIRDEYGHAVTYQTLRNWYPDLVAAS